MSADQLQFLKKTKYNRKFFNGAFVSKAKVAKANIWVGE